MGVHFDAFKDSTAKPTPMGKKQPRRSRYSSATMDSPKIDETDEWYLFSKNLSEEVLDNFDIPDRVSAFFTHILSFVRLL